MATIKDVAKRANVAISTVSRVLNNSGYTSEETRQKVLKTVKELNFRSNMIASAMINKKTSTFGLIIPDIKNIFYGDLTRAVEDMANKYGYNVILCNTDNDLDKEAEYVSFLVRKGVDAIIFSTPEVRDRNIKELIEGYPDLPVILLGSTVKGVELDEVLVDNFQGGHTATTHLLKKGHRRIAHITGQTSSYATIERKKGFEEALKEFEVSINEDWIITDEFKIESGYKNGLKLLQEENRPTAVFAGNDAIATGVYRAARELGLSIPEDLSVVGFDDSEYAQILYPLLTTIRTPIGDMGARAVEFGIQTIEGKKQFKETLVFRPTLIERDSTAIV
ncbi:LacI family DNA-binding transcriptional regulator [Alkalihalobacillus sp. AL-G]|uniref:LacI family DNA-binding transcriptional regulator n=1 Tax=Alkalihalobacillus sp. AL-G TaxID=2926399 RepID=UPI00272D393E|nr:LacI family DNA-binding transcriptional regulator [Alkalihalobacillus sp. AL-G]WLD93580.1 LacI family transcriptional regulator [Alkalihalobacillus sp. AL-G]